MEKHIKKLKQLDRIEYRIRSLENSKSYNGQLISGYSIAILTIIAFTSIGILAKLNGNLNEYINQIYAIGVIGSFMAVVTIGHAMVSLLLYELKLKKEYFDVVVKK